MNVHPLVAHLLQIDGDRKEKWHTLADKFNIKPGADNETKRKAASDIWRQFLDKVGRQGYTLETVKEVYKNGELLFETKARVPRTEEYSKEGMEIEKVTTNPYGGAWIKYKAGLGFTDDQVQQLSDSFNFRKFSSTVNIKASGTGIVDISDIHSGALVKVFAETVKQKQYDYRILTEYIDNAVDIINSCKFAEVHLFIPGDIIESFTGFNHRDTYKNVQYHQGDVVIISYEVIKRLLSGIKNLKKVYMVEGNHDRWTEHKDGNSRKGVVQVVSHFIRENSNIEVEYHPYMVRAEIDGIYHICTHGDYRSFDKKTSGGYDGFFFKYGKQGMYNVLRTGHYHRFNVLAQTPEYLHYECPSIFTGGLFEETLGFHTIPGISILRNYGDICSVEFRPVISYDRTNPKED